MTGNTFGFVVMDEAATPGLVEMVRWPRWPGNCMLREICSKGAMRATVPTQDGPVGVHSSIHALRGRVAVGLELICVQSSLIGGAVRAEDGLIQTVKLRRGELVLRLHVHTSAADQALILTPRTIKPRSSVP